MATVVFSSLFIFLGLVGMVIQYLIDSFVPIMIFVVVSAICLLTYCNASNKD